MTDGPTMITLSAADDESVTAAAVDDLVIMNNYDLGVYEAVIGGQTAAGLIYDKDGDRVVLQATSVLPEFRGLGVATKLISGVLDGLRMQGKTVTISCPFTAAFVDRHPEYADVVDRTHPGWHTARHQDAQ